MILIVVQAPTEFEMGLSFANILFLGVGGWVGVEIEVNANSAPNLVGVGAGAELGKNNYCNTNYIIQYSKPIQVIWMLKPAVERA